MSDPVRAIARIILDNEDEDYEVIARRIVAYLDDVKVAEDVKESVEDLKKTVADLLKKHAATERKYVELENYLRYYGPSPSSVTSPKPTTYSSYGSLYSTTVAGPTVAPGPATR